MALYEEMTPKLNLYANMGFIPWNLYFTSIPRGTQIYRFNLDTSLETHTIEVFGCTEA